MQIVTLGDLLLDVIVRLDEPLATGADADASTITTAGGQAANVAAWTAAPDGERTLASDRGTATLLAPDDLDPAWLACDCLHISGYALLASPIDEAAVRAAELART